MTCDFAEVFGEIIFWGVDDGQTTAKANAGVSPLPLRQAQGSVEMTDFEGSRDDGH